MPKPTVDAARPDVSDRAQMCDDAADIAALLAVKLRGIAREMAPNPATARDKSNEFGGVVEAAAELSDRLALRLGEVSSLLREGFIESPAESEEVAR